MILDRTLSVTYSAYEGEPWPEMAYYGQFLADLIAQGLTRDGIKNVVIDVEEGRMNECSHPVWLGGSEARQIALDVITGDAWEQWCAGGYRSYGKAENSIAY
jgi:hypothetical protein